MQTRKIVIAALIAILSASTFAGCEKEKAAEPPKPVEAQEPVTEEPIETTIDSVETIGDVIALERENTISSVNSSHVVYAFKYEDNYYRVIASISPELAEKYSSVDINDAEFNEKQEAIIAPLKIEKTELLNNQILTEEECTGLIGKTGEELTAAGWSFQDIHDLNTMQFWMNYGPFEYLVVFDGEIPSTQYEMFEENENMMDKTVKSVQFDSLGNATSLD